MSPATSYARLFRDGVLVDLLNPKTGLFFLAFLPQFVEPGRGPVAAQVLVLGVCFVVLAAMTDGAYALATSVVRHRMARRRSASRRPVLKRLSGAVYCALGGLTALA